ncbi:PTS sugar transporter subunit IIA [Rhizobium sp. BK060]|uniref:PTS sugar transporter subunit IIA n=1 Tax=Rhizobium sp. BK060 TaxID=2587096 RepID=UPI0017CA84F5|nr:PTS sugar transporter subunit IIA [Rhizobium sp. BK060]MBB3399438.1 PTS system nitrogen regulatory IIA component [Rhizobium sp. BK060]
MIDIDDMIMDLTNIFLPSDVFVGAPSQTKAKALHVAATKASEALGVDATSLLGVLEKRELLGSTGIGKGIAVPHAALPELGPPRGFIFQLSRPLDFDAIDEAPVDLIFLLVFGEEWRSDYLKVLATIARKGHHTAIISAMRNAEDSASLYAAFMASEELPQPQPPG